MKSEEELMLETLIHALKTVRSQLQWHRYKSPVPVNDDYALRQADAALTNFAGNSAQLNKNNIGEHGVCGDVRAESLKHHD